jgi:hypothetical protein
VNDVVDNDKSKRKRGRPPYLTDEERAERKKMWNRKRNTVYRRNGSQRDTYYMPAVLIPKELQQALVDLAKSKNMTISRLFLTAVEEKYRIKLTLNSQLPERSCVAWQPKNNLVEKE